MTEQQLPPDVIQELALRQQLLNEQNQRSDARHKQRVAGWGTFGAVITSFIPHHILIAAGTAGVWADSRSHVRDHDVNICILSNQIKGIQAQRRTPPAR